MPSFDIVSEVNRMEIENALNQARKELLTRFDFKGVKASFELPQPNTVLLVIDDRDRLAALREILIGKFAKRNIDLRNIVTQDPDVSSLGHARQKIDILQGLEGNKAKEIIQAIKAEKLKVQSSLMDRQIRVSGNKKDDLQKVIAFLRAQDFGIALDFKNFRG